MVESINNSKPIQVVNLEDNNKIEELKTNFQTGQEAKSVSKSDKYVLFEQWCAKVGIKYPKLRFPVLFEDKQSHLSYIGVQAKEDIQHREGFLSVPFDVIINQDTVNNDPVLGPIVESCPLLFDPEECDDSEQLKLCIFLLYEWQKKDQSFWYPYINMLPDVQFFYEWDPEVKSQVQDDRLLIECEEYQIEVELQWDMLHRLFEENEQVFKEILNHKDPEALFRLMYARVCTRCFGYGVPSTSMIPMGDNFNHHHTNNCYQVVNKTLQLMEKKEQGSYFNLQKSVMNSTLCYHEIEVKQMTEKEQKIIKGFQQYENFAIYQEMQTIKGWKEQIKNQELWNLIWKRKLHVDQNDSESEEDSEEEDQDEQDKQQDNHKEDQQDEQQIEEIIDTNDIDQIIRKEQQILDLENEEEQKNLKPDYIDMLMNNPDRRQEYLKDDSKFEWYRGNEQIMDKTTYFLMYTANGVPTKAGDQQYFFYGKRNNRFLLLNYGFSYMNNKYDSISFYVNQGADSTNPQIESTQFKSLISFTYLDGYKKIKLQLDVLSDELLNYLRVILRENQDVKVCQITSLDLERKVLDAYAKIMVHLVTHIEKETSLERDLELLSDSLLPTDLRFVIIYRSERKKIVHSQLHMLDFMIQMLSKSMNVLQPTVDKNLSEEEQTNMAADKFRQLVMSPTKFEQDEFNHKLITDKTKIEERYFVRRLIHAQYLKQVKEVTLEKIKQQ